MTPDGAGSGAAPMPVWLDREGRPVSCREKLVVLAENEAELAGVMRDAFEDAILMGLDEAALRTRLHTMVDRLASPLAG